MKILRLDLRAFGPFTDVSLDLSGGSEGLHVIYGPNEAGKSSSLRALEQMLFGIPAQTPDAFLHPYDRLRVGATLQLRGQPPLSFLRRKGNKKTLLGSDNATPLDDAALQPLLGGMDRELFGRMFGIGHEQLVHGGREIAAGSGNVGELLFAAGAGIADLQQIVAQLERQAAELFLPRGQKPQINQHLKLLDDARKKIRQAQLPSDEWVEHDRALREARQRSREAGAELAKHQAERNRLERISRALPAIAKRKDLRRQLNELGEVILLSADFAEKRRDVMTRLAVEQKTRQTADEELARVERDLQAIDVPESLLAHRDAIERLPDELGSFRKAQRDLPTLGARREQLLREAAALLQQVRPDLAIEEADRLRLTSLQQLALQKLAGKHGALVQKLQQASEESAQIDRALAEAAREIERMPEPRDPAPLKDALRRAQNQGDLEEQLRDATAKLQRMREKAAADLKKLRLFSGTLEELEKLVLPTAETVERFRVQFAQAEQQTQRLEASLDDLQQKQAELQRQLEQLQLEGEVPSEEDLLEARRVRDAGWQLILEEWHDGKSDRQLFAADFLGRFPNAKDLAAAYQEAVHKADELADRLRREASRVTRRAALLAEHRAVQRQIEKLRQEHDRAEQSRRRVEQSWADEWRPAGIVPLSPQEMQGFLLAHRALEEQVETIRGQQADVDQLQCRIETHQAELCRLLEAIQTPPEGRREGLVALVQWSQTVLDRLDAAAQRRTRLDRDVETFKSNRAAAQAKAARAQAELADWMNQWATALEPLGLPAGSEPETALHVLSETGKLLASLKDAEELAERIRGIEREAAHFARLVKEQVEQACPDLASRVAEQAAEQMIQRLRKAAADRQRQQELLQKRNRYQAELEKSRRAIEQFDARLKTLCAEAGCRDADDLPAVERASDSARRLREMLQAVDDQLAATSGGASLEVFVAQVEAESADQLPSRLAELDEEIHRLESQRDELQRTIGAEEQLLAGMDGNADAADAAEDVQALVSRLESDALQYARLQMAKEILRESIERYRKKNEGPVLRRAGELFGQLTRGSFAGLCVDFNEQGQSVLKGVRPHQGQTVELSGMSEGTADQLYLALRLASLESYLDGKEPMPFVVDDVLIGFDDDRAIIALEILAEFSRRTQVIFFTHHAHLVRLAESRLDPSLLLIHELRS